MIVSQFYCVKCDKWFRQPIVFRRHQRECLIITMPQRNEEAEEEDNDEDNDENKKELRIENKNKNSLNRETKKESAVPVFSSRSSSPTKSPVKLETSTKATAGKRKLSLQNSIVNEQENKRTRLARTASAIALTAFKIPEPIVPGVKRRLGRPPKNPKPVDNSLKPEEEQQEENLKEDEKKINATSKSLISPITLPKSKRLLSKLITSQMTQSSRISTLKPTPASSALAAEPKKQKKKPGPKPKSSRLSSVSSIGSSSQSSNSKQLTRSTNKPGRPSRQLVAVDFEDTNNQSQDDDLDLDDDEIDEIDDIAVSDYEMDENTNASKQSTDTTTGAVNNLVTNAVANIKQETTLKSSNTNLSLTQTYKVKIQLCRPPSINTAASSNQLQASTSAASAVASASSALVANSSTTPNINSTTPSSKQHKEKENESILPLTPLKANAFVLNTPTATPSKQMTHMNSNLSVNASQNEPTESTNQNTNNSNVTTYFECPECDKKFVSQYGLLQHYDQHPTLAVTCSLCQITFENHHVLILHYKNAHNIKEKSERDSTASTNSKQQLNVIKKPDVKQKTFKSTGKSKQTSEDLIDVTGNITNDLSALPSIMTRTSRITNFSNNNNINNNSNHLNSTKPGLIAAAALLNHNLKYKTSGFADLSFIDFSCVNFPRIAQNFCEIWPRKLHAESTFQQPLHNYMCQKCGFYFPCKASLALHEMNKKFATSKLKAVTREIDSDQEKKNIDQAEEGEQRLNKNDSKKKITSRCELFMTNSKYLCYEKCLDEIITKIEDSFKSEDDDQEDKTCEFLKSFGLVPAKSLPVAAEGTEKKDQEKYLNLTEKLMLKLREQMLDINYQFIIDLDRWKFMHSTASVSTSATESNSEQSNDYYFHDTNKIHLKPHINLNRPLLIRSKKLKRNTFKASQTTIAAAAVTAAANKLHQRAQAAKPPQSQPQPSQPQQLNTFKSLLNAINSVNITSSTAKSSEVKTSHSSTTAKFSKPFFSATSG